MDDLSSNITFTGDYDALQASNQLEITRAMIYNYLLSIGMPLNSDIVLIKGTQFHLVDKKHHLFQVVWSFYSTLTHLQKILHRP